MPTKSITLAIPAEADEYAPDMPLGISKEITYEVQAEVQTLPAGASVELVLPRPTTGLTGPAATWDAEGVQEPVPLAAWPGPLVLRGKSGGTAGDAVVHLNWW